MSLTWSLLLVPILIALNAFFVMAEYALVAIRPTQIDLMHSTGKHRAAAAMERLKSDPASAIGAIQVCITMTNLLLGWIGEPAMSEVLHRLLGPLAHAIPPGIFTTISTALSFIVVTLLTVVFSELLPKALTLRFVVPAGSLTSVPILYTMRGIKPLVWLMNAMANAVTIPLGLGRVDELEKQTHTAEEIIAITREAAADKVLTERERSIILNALAMGRRAARHIVVPRGKLAYLDLQWSMAENRRQVQQHLFNRMPLCNGGLDHVVGVVSVAEFLTAYYGHGDSSVLQLIAQPAIFVPTGMPIDKLLTTLLETKSKMVFVVDEYGGLNGIVTFDDVMDELLGTYSVRPEGPPITQAGEAAPPVATSPLVVAGDTAVHEVAARIGRDGWGENPDVVTIAGLIVSRLGRVPDAGEELTIEGVLLRVLSSDGRAVREVEVVPQNGLIEPTDSGHGVTVPSERKP